VKTELPSFSEKQTRIYLFFEKICIFCILLCLGIEKIIQYQELGYLPVVYHKN